jgi:predicted MPP superfamily phosphohydrolase
MEENGVEKSQELIDQKLHDLNDDGVDRRGFLKCMAWAGTGLVWTISGGIPVSRAFAKKIQQGSNQNAELTFVQISDSHMGFNKPANPDVVATLQAAISKINGLEKPPEFLIHTGDIIRQCRSDFEKRKRERRVLRARGTRRARRQWQVVSGSLRKEREGCRLVQL